MAVDDADEMTYMLLAVEALRRVSHGVLCVESVCAVAFSVAEMIEAVSRS